MENHCYKDRARLKRGKGLGRGVEDIQPLMVRRKRSRKGEG
jgi:hypothetical protein